MSRIVRLCTLLLLCVTISGCQLLEREKSDKPSPDWSRGLWVGETYLNSPVGMAVAPDGSRVHLAWSARADEARVIHYRQLDQAATTLVDVDLTLQPGAYRPQLALDGEGGLHLLWLAPLRGVRALYHGRLQEDGQMGGQMTLLSAPNDQVESFHVLTNPPRGLEVFWVVEGKGGYHLGLSPDGTPLDETTLLCPEATSLHAQRDLKETVHLIWDTGKVSFHDIYYATFDPTTKTLGPATRVTHFSEATGDILRGPFLGLDLTHGYVLWSIEHRGQASGSAEAWYAPFPLEAPATVLPQEFLLPVTADGAYETVTTAPFEDFGLLRPPSQLPRAVGAQPQWAWRSFIPVPVSGTPGWSDWVESPVPLPGQQTALIATATLRVQQRMDRKVQPVELLINPEGPKGYALAGRTDAVSLQPRMLMDHQGNSHLTWLDTAGFGRFRIYYATTAPTARAILDTTTPADVVTYSLELAWSVLSSLAFTPIVIVWALPSLLWLGIFYLATAEDNLNVPKTKVAFVVAIALYGLGKFACVPGYLLYVPFYDRIPLEWTGVWVTAVPLAILGTAIAGALLFLRRRDSASLFVGTVATILIDAILTFVIYTPGVLGLV